MTQKKLKKVFRNHTLGGFGDRLEHYKMPTPQYLKFQKCLVTELSIFLLKYLKLISIISN